MKQEEFLPEKQNKYWPGGLTAGNRAYSLSYRQKQLYSARKRLIFDEFFMFIYNIRNLKDKIPKFITGIYWRNQKKLKL